MDNSEEPPCQCEGPSFCPRYGIQMNSHMHSVCSGNGCSPQKSQLYRQKWRKLSDQRTSRGLTVIVPTNPTTPSERKVQTRQPKQSSPPIPQAGPGTELKELLASIGLTPQGCRCESRVQQMNKWGIEGCRNPTNRDYIVNWLRTEEKKRGWAEKLKAGLLTITTGLASELSLTDPLGSLVDVAISRAEKRR